MVLRAPLAPQSFLELPSTPIDHRTPIGLGGFAKRKESAGPLGARACSGSPTEFWPNLALDSPTRIRRTTRSAPSNASKTPLLPILLPSLPIFCRCCRLSFYPRSPKTAQDASKTPPRCPKTPPRPPKSRPRAPKSPPRRPRTPKMEPCWGPCWH